MIVKIVLGIGIVNGLIMKRFLFYRLWIPTSAAVHARVSSSHAITRCFVGRELHDDAIVLKIGHSANTSVCPIDFRLTRDPFRLLEEIGFCCERTPVQFFRFVDMKPIFDKGYMYHGGHSLLEFAREVRAAVNVHAEVKGGAVCTDTKGWHGISVVSYSPHFDAFSKILLHSLLLHS